MVVHLKQGWLTSLQRQARWAGALVPRCQGLLARGGRRQVPARSGSSLHSGRAKMEGNRNGSNAFMQAWQTWFWHCLAVGPNAFDAVDMVLTPAGVFQYNLNCQTCCHCHG